MTSNSNPCLGCGACCAFFRASFYWAETECGTPGGVPDHLTEKINEFRVQMKGTRGPQPRCVALTGEIGQNAACGIYQQRSSVCRAFLPSWADGITGNKDCDRARAAHNLEALQPDAWQESYSS
ncbi:YkgJ family cysteine cluster protein [Desulfobulbus sp. F4]|nr:YkgJ family cysteine cluster protein [Desulfobulbus sp. F3]MCW5200680.1 YkgJ family cysteine cluster protein [Desulfobulbus sp. F4]